MSKLSSIVADLKKQSTENEERAYRILGAKPGPGLDLEIYPHLGRTLNGKWTAIGLTEAGKKFIAKFWCYQPLSNQKVAELRKQAMEWGLKFKTKYQVTSLMEAKDDTTGASGPRHNQRAGKTSRRT